MKKFFSAEDIENLAAQGTAELIIDDNSVLTDLARHTAGRLGIAIINRSQTAPTTTTPLPASSPAPSPSPVSGLPPRPAVRVGSKPKGCQHGPLISQQPPVETTVPGNMSSDAAPSNTVVDQLVGLVKRLGNKGSNS